jgi:hypothetical protein
MSDSLIIKLGADTSAFKGEISKVASHAKDQLGEKAGSSTGEKFGKAFMKKVNIDKAFKSLVAAIGIDINKLGESVARLWTGLSKEQEESFKELESLSERAADASIVAARASLNEEKKYQLALREREGAMRRMAEIDGSTAKGQVELKKQEIRLAENSLIISQHELELEKKITDQIKDRIAVNEAGRKSRVDDLPLLAQRIAKQKEDVELAKQAININYDMAVKDQWRNVLKQRQVDLEKMIVDFKKSHALTDSEAIESLNIQARILTGRMLPADKARYDQLKLITKERENQGKIETILAVPAERRTREEKTTLAVLLQQNEKLEKQIALKQELIDKAKEQQKEEIKVRQAMGGTEGFSGDTGVLKTLGGFKTYFEPTMQKEYEESLLASAARSINSEIETLQKKVDMYRTSGAGIGKFQVPALTGRISALRGRLNNLNDYVFNPNYKDQAGEGIFASQVSTIGDPLNLQNKQTDVLQSVAGGISQLNRRLQMNGFNLQ